MTYRCIRNEVYNKEMKKSNSTTLRMIQTRACFNIPLTPCRAGMSNSQRAAPFFYYCGPPHLRKKWILYILISHFLKGYNMQSYCSCFFFTIYFGTPIWTQKRAQRWFGNFSGCTHFRFFSILPIKFFNIHTYSNRYKKKIS